MPYETKTAFGLTGLTSALAALDKVSDRLRGKVLRKALTAGQKPLIAAARSRAPKRTGLLRKSLGSKVKIYRTSNSFVAVTGPRTSIQGEHKGKKVVPARYAHLVELGTKRASPHPFLVPAAQSSQAAILVAMNRVIAADLARAAT